MPLYGAGEHWSFLVLIFLSANLGVALSTETQKGCALFFSLLPLLRSLTTGVQERSCRADSKETLRRNRRYMLYTAQHTLVPIQEPVLQAAICASHVGM